MDIQALRLVTCFLWAVRFLAVVLGALYGAQFGENSVATPQVMSPTHRMARKGHLMGGGQDYQISSFR